MKKPGTPQADRLLQWGLPCVLALCAALLTVTAPGLVGRMRLAVFDQYQRWVPPTATVEHAVVVDIDEDSLHRWGPWPWPHARWAELLQKLHGAGATVVGLDILLAEPDRDDASGRSDRALANTLQTMPVVLGVALTGEPHEEQVDVRAKFVQLGAGVQDRLLTYQGALQPLGTLRTQATGLGALNFVPDEDGVLRRIPLVSRVHDALVPAMSLELLRLMQKQSNVMLEGMHGADASAVGMQSLRVGSVRVSVNPQGELWLRDRPLGAVQHISVNAVLSGRMAPEAVRGKVVMVGATAIGLMDTRMGARGELVPGVDFHALALDTMLRGQALIRPDWALALELLLAGLGSALAGWLVLRWSVVRAGVLVVSGLAAMVALGVVAFEQLHVLIDVLSPAVFSLLSFTLCGAVSHLRSERQQRWVRSAFEHYVSPNKVAHLMRHPESMALSGERRVCSFIFTDIQGSTTMLEQLDPALVVEALNQYLEGMLNIVFKHDGTLDRFIGDGLVIMFSAPVVQPDHAQRALACARELHAFTQEFATARQAQGMPFGHTRIGVHAGEVIVGNFGGHALLDYRALGDPINVAARLESANRYFGTWLCVSEVIAQAQPGEVMRPVGRLVLKGRQQALMAYEPLSPSETARAPLAQYLLAYQAMAALDEQSNDDAAQVVLSSWATLAEQYPQDPLIHYHLLRLQQGERGDRVVMSGK